MSARVFLDTNVLVYALGADDKAEVARAVLTRPCATSVQVLGELTHVARRKLGMDRDEIARARSALIRLCRPIVPTTLETSEWAFALARRYGFSYYDALVVAGALETGCTRLLSEDMHAGLVVEGELVIENPFAG